jgi:hypothetical protein
LSKNIPGRGEQRLLALARRFQANEFLKVVGVTGFEPVTLRLSSACSNQLSYTPRLGAFALQRGWPAGLPARGPPQNAAPVGPPKTGPPSRSLACEGRLVELRRLELLTYSLQSYRSTN